MPGVERFHQNQPRPTNGILFAMTVMNKHIGVERQARHIDYRVADMVGLHARFNHLAAIGL